MKIGSYLLISLVLVIPYAFVSGCGGSSTGGKDMKNTTGSPAAKDGLMDLSLLLTEIKAAKGKMPSSANDFAQHDIAHPAAGVTAVNGTIVYLVGATVDAKDTSGKLVAMQKDADKSGGWVLLSNGEVKDLSAAEVTALPLGGKMPKK